MEDKVQRFIGTCQICEGEFKLDLNTTMVHHGYKRPGHGYIVGDCAAVGHPAYEQSCELLKSYTASLRTMLDSGREHLRKLEAGEVTQLTGVSLETRYALKRNQKMVVYKVGEEGFSDVLSSKIREQRQMCEWLVSDIKRCEARIAAWKPLPVRTIEEAAAEKRTAKDVAAATREAKRAAKLAEKVASYQKRIDAAVRNHTTTTLADVFESAPSKLREIAGYDKLTAAQAIALLERDHVWTAFGLDITMPKPESGGVRSKNADTCSNMRYPEYHFETNKYPWPEGLK